VDAFMDFALTFIITITKTTRLSVTVTVGVVDRRYGER